MDYTTLETRFREWKAALKRIPGIFHSVAPATSSPEWYAGLAVSPAKFSRQLGDMQVSLLRANRPRMAEKQVVPVAGIMQAESSKALN